MSIDFLRYWSELDPPRPRVSQKGLDLARVPREFWKDDPALLSTLRHGPIIANYLAELPQHHKSRTGLLLWGPRGSGKSSIAARVLIEVERRADPVTRSLWVSAKECAHYHKNFSETDEDGRRMSERMLWNTWLVLDELGAEHREWDGPAIEAVVKTRYHNRRPTIITTNLDLRQNDGVLSRYPWLVGLLTQRYLVVEVPGSDNGGRNWREGAP